MCKKKNCEPFFQLEEVGKTIKIRKASSLYFAFCCSFLSFALDRKIAPYRNASLLIIKDKLFWPCLVLTVN